VKRLHLPIDSVLRSRPRGSEDRFLKSVCQKTTSSKGVQVMKRMHVHVSVEDLQQSIGFYLALFDTEPAVVKPDYAKWMLDDPRVNFAISTRGRQPGLDHLGIQVENKTELHEVYARLRKAGGTVIEQGATACCYAKSEKSWIDDPAGIAWETFHTTGENIEYGDGTGEREARVAHATACCVPKSSAAPVSASADCQ
jgi:predicted enzyme related to lactoylglutathione lyase